MSDSAGDRLSAVGGSWAAEYKEHHEGSVISFWAHAPCSEAACGRYGSSVTWAAAEL